MRLLAVMGLALAMGGCVTKVEKDEYRKNLEAQWRIDNAMPSATPLPDEAKKKLDADTDTWEVEENKRRAAKLAEGGGRLAAGDIIGGIVILLGLGGMAYDGYKAVKKKGA